MNPVMTLSATGIQFCMRSLIIAALSLLVGAGAALAKDPEYADVQGIQPGGAAPCGRTVDFNNR